MSGDNPLTDPKEKRQALEAALKSRALARSEQLQAFLRYVCELELAGRGDEITEYAIATEALNRRTDYAPGEDSSVRSRAHALRRKLQEYYDTESPESVWRIELPKGSYRPLFVRSSELQTPKPVVAPVAVSSPSPRFSHPFLLGFSLAAAIAVAVFSVYFSGLSRSAIDPIVQEAWGPALSPSSEVLVAVACPPMNRLVSSYPGLLPKMTGVVQTPQEISTWFGSLNLENRGGPLYMFPVRGYTQFSDTLAAGHVASLIKSAGANCQTIPEPSAQPMGIHEDGLILIGSPPNAALIARLLKSTPFSIHFDPTHNDEVISEGPPSSSKRVFLAMRNQSTNRFSKVYGLITVLPSQPGRDKPSRTLIFSGISGSPGGQAAVQYFSLPAALRELKERFRREGYRQFPPAYQVVVRCGVDSEVAINTVYEAHIVMSHPPVIE